MVYIIKISKMCYKTTLHNGNSLKIEHYRLRCTKIMLMSINYLLTISIFNASLILKNLSNASFLYYNERIKSLYSLLLF